MKPSASWSPNVSSRSDGDLAPAPVCACRGRRSLRGRRRWFVLGGVLLVIGVLAGIGGGALMALFGSNDTLNSGVQQVSTCQSL